MMKKLAIVFAVGAAALMGGSAAYAADNAVKSKSSTDAAQSGVGTQSRIAKQSSTDISAHRRYRHWHGHHHWHHRHYRPYYGSYNYYTPRRYGYYGPRYYGGGPGVTFSFGGGGYRGW